MRTKDVDSLIPRLDIKIVKENGRHILVIDGSRTIVVDDNEIKQNGLELYARIEQELDTLKSIHSRLKTLFQEVGLALVDKPEKVKGKTSYYAIPVQEGRRQLEINKTKSSSVAWKKFLEHTLDLDDKGLQKHLAAHGKHFVSTSYRTKIKIR